MATSLATKMKALGLPYHYSTASQLAIGIKNSPVPAVVAVCHKDHKYDAYVGFYNAEDAQPIIEDAQKVEAVVEVVLMQSINFS